LRLSNKKLMHRIDIYPTHIHGNLQFRRGRPFPYGASFVFGGINFSIYSAHATACTLLLYEKGAREPFAEIPFPEDFRIGSVFAMIVFDLDYENLEYGYRFDGPWDPENGHRFDASMVLLDPYARQIGGRSVWGQTPDKDDPYPYRAQILINDFDWEHDAPPNIPMEDLVIYEMHVRGFTRHYSSGVKHPGTYAAIRDKIPYFKELGINAVELMPVFEFDEFEYAHRVNPETGEPLKNYWGYSTVGFFAPKAGFAAGGRFAMQADELKTLVKELHQNGIEVFLDVVFNHTSEGDERGPTTSFRGIDNKTYYMLAPDGGYFNFSGTGNTLNCNHPVVRELVIDCLRYWAFEYHIDGFRFDLASILGRAQDGTPLANPPLIEALAYDPILAKRKLIAEAWDAGGLYQVGTFPAYGRWAEWNGKYRSAIRRWVKGDDGLIEEVARRINGSPDLYQTRGPTASINFITCHDGFTLRDLFSYNEKHNLANGEENRDGGNDNDSWNCGVEGPTDDPEVLALRDRLMRNAIAILMISQGVPMLRMGDEYGHTSFGNNNTYCHDNELTWFNWEQLEENAELFQFHRKMIAFRHAYPILRYPRFLTPVVRERTISVREASGPVDDVKSRKRKVIRVIEYPDTVDATQCPELTWHGVKAGRPDWAWWNRTLAFMLCNRSIRREDEPLDTVYVAMNMHWEPHPFSLPRLLDGRRWYLALDTGATAPDDIYELGAEPLLADQKTLEMVERSVVALVAK
jgi:isoamylase